MYASIATAFYIAGILCAIEAVMNTRTAQGATAWSVSLVSFPFVAVPAYLVFGRNKFEGMQETYAARKDEIDGLLEKYETEMSPWRVAIGTGEPWYRALQSISGLWQTRANRVDLLVNGERTFDSILEGIAGAREYILFQFYMIHDDELGRRVQSALIERARAGVRVLVLYDEVGSKGLTAAYLEELRQAGVQVSSFKPTQGWRNRFQINFRNHRKMVVVDGRVGWVGGHNVGDEYLGKDPEFSPWRDTHVRIEGPAAQQLQRVILWDWYWATRQIPEVSWQPVPAPESDTRAMILATGPNERLETASLFFVSALSGAQQRIWITAPYFVPDDAVMKALQLAALRGVDVRILTTGKGDSLPVYLAAFDYIYRLRGLGIRFYAYRPGFLHQKVVLVDDRISAVGTHNFDNRSFRLNFEVTAIVVDEGFAGKMETMFVQDFEHAELIDPEALDQKPFWWRLGVQVSRLASPVL
ncbi:cardiolipin synthase [Parahaliea maris]|uniref:Cardiolipin synthase n=1 Tax=Parahaliea maris TaxID=2716870 RepID=A0A5C8ZW68_9GAMM|nr:cardiolipin synthase [Parahaliea maris]TXS92696.1 cardiolipin synthase [Parahaliea maris]